VDVAILAEEAEDAEPAKAQEAMVAKATPPMDLLPRDPEEKQQAISIRVKRSLETMSLHMALTTTRVTVGENG
jgi:hypothetical protein